MNIVSIIIRLVVASLLCGVIGFEREHKHKPAGLRTLMLVGLGTAAMTIASIEMGGWIFNGQVSVDPSRIASTILTGIGFLGAGSIIQARGSVQGLTTAASIWVVAAIGLASGLGMMWLAVITTLIAVIVLVMVPTHIDTKDETMPR